jgi:hypothetical protein
MEARQRPGRRPPTAGGRPPGRRIRQRVCRCRGSVRRAALLRPRTAGRRGTGAPARRAGRRCAAARYGSIIRHSMCGKAPVVSPGLSRLRSVHVSKRVSAVPCRSRAATASSPAWSPAASALTSADTAMVSPRGIADFSDPTAAHTKTRSGPHRVGMNAEGHGCGGGAIRAGSAVLPMDVLRTGRYASRDGAPPCRKSMV